MDKLKDVVATCAGGKELIIIRDRKNNREYKLFNFPPFSHLIERLGERLVRDHWKDGKSGLIILI